ncbi:MAG: HEPN domain-containing protein [Mariprofundaceae bacterium]|nr:HEPN domain-containing protein [Mariprofundaceae bacterium]
MSDPLDLVQSWKVKSEHDLKACRQLLNVDDPLVEIIAFHAQQAVEKALKGSLISRKCFNFPKTHDLGRLLDLAEEFESELSNLDAIIELTPYAVEIRYPESLDWSNDIDANAYVVLAEQSCKKIWSYMAVV